MLPPRVTDDGRTVTLDLHGARVAEAEHLLRRAAALAASRGRATLRVVHGASTSDPLARNRTVRHALHELLDAGALRPWVVDAVRSEGYAILALAASAGRDATRIVLRDLGAVSPAP